MHQCSTRPITKTCLHIVVSELQHPPRGLSDNRESFLDDVVKALPLGEPVAELLRLGPATNRQLRLSESAAERMKSPCDMMEIPRIEIVPRAESTPVYVGRRLIMTGTKRTRCRLCR